MNDFWVQINRKQQYLNILKCYSTKCHKNLFISESANIFVSYLLWYSIEKSYKVIYRFCWKETFKKYFSTNSNKSSPLCECLVSCGYFLCHIIVVVKLSTCRVLIFWILIRILYEQCHTPSDSCPIPSLLLHWAIRFLDAEDINETYLCWTFNQHLELAVPFLSNW